MWPIARCIAILLFAVGAAHAQEGKPLRFMVAFTPGGTADTLARVISQKLAELKAMQAVVENRGGVGGTIGLEAFKTWPADGTSFSVVSNSQVISQIVYPKVTYDLSRDFEPILFLGSSPMVIAVNPTRVDARTLDEALALAQKEPGRYAYGECAPGSAHHIAMELLKSRTRTDIRHIGYRGCSQSVADAIGGQLDFVIASSSAALPHVRSGKLRGLAVTGAQRSPAAPELPAVGEAKTPGAAGFAVDNWYALIAVQGTPREAVARMESAVREVMARPEVVERLGAAGIDVRLAGADALRAAVAEDLRSFRPVIERAGITPH
jgi:tripartite-type tricarboxylate transporter receptor subunit TctC